MLVLICRVGDGGDIARKLCKNNPGHPMLAEIRKEALKHHSLAFKEFDWLLSWLLLRHFQVISLSYGEKKMTKGDAP